MNTARSIIRHRAQAKSARFNARRDLERAIVVAESATTAVDGKTYQAEYFKLDVIIELKPSVFIDDQRAPGEAEMEVGRPARVDAEHLHDVKPHRIGQGQVLVGEPA